MKIMLIRHFATPGNEKRQFGGITGDLAGYFLQICELVMLTVVAFLGGIC